MKKIKTKRQNIVKLQITKNKLQTNYKLQFPKLQTVLLISNKIISSFYNKTFLEVQEPKRMSNNEQGTPNVEVNLLLPKFIILCSIFVIRYSIMFLVAEDKKLGILKEE
jgi:hypothetical protein